MLAKVFTRACARESIEDGCSVAGGRRLVEGSTMVNALLVQGQLTGGIGELI